MTPLRSGASVPGVVEADDLGTYVVKLSTWAVSFGSPNPWHVRALVEGASGGLCSLAALYVGGS
ncbi:hypothetical protein GCM10010307_57190 [Streptomyces vastus]|uniref:Uncharacterized protein n=1 Tax=Streptomyces vastus TaxID=285451 RepID=A0ABP6DPG0_9ACTN